MCSVWCYDSFVKNFGAFQVMKLEMSDAKRKKYIELLSAVGAIALLYLVFSLVGIGCPIKFITGISCAGCGMTRAYKALLHLDFARAFYFHPLFWLVPVDVVFSILKNKISIKFYKSVIFTSTVAFVIVYLYRMIWGADDIVVFRPSESVIYRVILFFKQ